MLSSSTVLNSALDTDPVKSPSTSGMPLKSIVEENPGPTWYSHVYDGFELSGCELICIGERNFTNSKFEYPKKR